MCGDTQINASELRAALNALKRLTSSRKTELEHQFWVLEKVSPDLAEARAVTAWRNHKKNRSMEFPPGTSTACLLLHYHMAVYTVPSGQMESGSERRVPRLHLCLLCACKLFLWV